MKDRIEAALRPLLSEPLTDMWRYVGHQRFEFGEQRPCKNRKGQDITRADLAVVALCHWRISRADGSSVSRCNFRSSTEPGDEAAGRFVEECLDSQPVVLEITAQDSGGVHLVLAHGYELWLEPDPDDASELDEEWRFLPRDHAERHFVVTAHGIEE
jgi:hypothetical protein